MSRRFFCLVGFGQSPLSSFKLLFRHLKMETDHSLKLRLEIGRNYQTESRNLLGKVFSAAILL